MGREVSSEEDLMCVLSTLRSKRRLVWVIYRQNGDGVFLKGPR